MRSGIFQFDHPFLDVAIRLGQAPTLPPKGRVLSITPRQDGEDRAREVVSRSNYRATGKYPSWKMRRHLHWESHNELNAFRLLDADPTVIRFHEQPFEIVYELDGVEHSHYPDVLVEKRDGKELWEIKSAQWAYSEKHRTRSALMMAALPEHGYQYLAVIAEDLRQKPRLDNVSSLLDWGRQPIDVVNRESLRLRFESTPSITWGEVLDGALGAQGRRHASRLVLEGLLSFDLHKALSRDTVLAYTGAHQHRLDLEA